MPPLRNISKSRFCAGLQCLRRLWWEVHEPDAPELRPDPRQQAIFDRGHCVGELARQQFRGGELIDFGPRQVSERLAATAAALSRGAGIVFEASFAGGGVFAALDVLEKARRGWTLVEVKATLDVKEQFIPDVAVQVHAARAAGIDVRRADLMHLNRSCAFPDLEDLFVREDVTAAAEELLPVIPRQVRAMREALEASLPDVEPADQCGAPYECPFVERCHPELPEHHVSSLYSVRAQRIRALCDAGTATIHDLPEGLRLSEVQTRQVRAVKSGRLVVEEGLRSALARMERPLAFLDFESINPPVPVWRGCHPYEQVPVQMSCHVLGPRGRTEHHDHLAEGPGDPRPALAEAVVRACGEARSVVAYNSGFEARCLDHLAAAVPALAKPLQAIRKRLVDLLPIVRSHVYHPDFGGSFSLKSVAPALLRLGYDDLDVSDGDSASALLEGLLLAPERLSATQQADIRKQLLAYCERDTFALVKLHERLTELS